jgi:hypothetical protein
MCVIKIHAFTSMGRLPSWSGTLTVHGFFNLWCASFYNETMHTVFFSSFLECTLYITAHAVRFNYCGNDRKLMQCQSILKLSKWAFSSDDSTQNLIANYVSHMSFCTENIRWIHAYCIQYFKWNNLVTKSPTTFQRLFYMNFPFLKEYYWKDT